MKKLFFKIGSCVNAKTSEDYEGKYISVYNDDEKPKLVYSVQKGSKVSNKNVLFADGLTDLCWYEVQFMAEIIENFDQYYNMLNQ